MKKIFLISFFLVSTISANENVWKPTSDYFVDCSFTYNSSAYGPVLIKRYAHYDLDKERKFVTDFYTKGDGGEGFSYSEFTAIREYSSDSIHKFYIYDYKVSNNGEIREFEYSFKDKKVILDRENIKMSLSVGLGRNEMYKCSIMTAKEYQIAINDVKKERDAAYQDFIDSSEKRKSQLKL